MRTILLLGHGGKAQAEVALATAYRAATLGRRTLLASSGPHHRIGTLLGRKLTAKATELLPNLYATEAAPLGELDRQWAELARDARGLLASRLRDIRGDELPLIPGIDELAGTLGVERIRKAGKFDLVVVDGPPLTQLLRTLSLPDGLRWAVRQLIGLDRGPGRSRASQEAALLPAGLVPQTISEPLQNLRVYLEEQRALFEPGNGTVVRVVLPAEDLELPATRQSIGGLGLYGLSLDAIIASGVQQAPGEVAALFAPRPLLAWTAGEGDWAERGAQLYGEQRPDAPLVELSDSAAQGELAIRIPYLEAGGVQIADTGDEAIVQYGPYRRHMLLPAALRGLGLRARVEGELLRLYGEEKAP
jgi:arsenite/tail-anchored protein-transporting ATPase